MKKWNQLAFVLITALGVSSLISCNEKKQVLSDDVQDVRADGDANDRVDEMRENIKEERELFIVQAREKIAENKRDIEDLKIVAKTKKDKAREEYDKAIEKLKEENDRLEARIDQNKEAIDEDWENFKKEFNSDMDRLGGAIGDLFKDNEKDK